MRDPEFDLLVAACSVSFRDRPLAAPPVAVRWDRLLALAARHRVQALCWNGLGSVANEVPEGIAATFRDQARAIVVANLRGASECARLHQSFAAAGVPLMFLKGLTVGALAYRDPFLKMAVDIDLLIEPARLADAARELRLAGYAPIVPAGADDAALGGWHRAHKESVWHRPDGTFQLDLHTRLADHPAMLAGLTAASPLRLVQVAPGISLPTLDNHELFAYLCVHGASSAWFRLKWITDFAALLRDRTAEEIDGLWGRSQRLGVGRAAGQALILADRIYSIRLGDELRSRLAADPAIRGLAKLAENQLLDPREPTERPLGTATIHLSQLALLPGWRFKASEAARQLRDIARRAPPSR